jgi:hypothetical protein
MILLLPCKTVEFATPHIERSGDDATRRSHRETRAESTHDSVQLRLSTYDFLSTQYHGTVN